MLSILVNDTFDTYDNDTELWNTWTSSNSSDDAVLTSDSGLYPGIQGQGVNHIGGSVNEYSLPLGPTGTLMPTESQNIVFSVDIYDNSQGNVRLTAGLRYTGSYTDTENIIELGFWNADTGDTALYPLQSGYIGYAFRAIIFTRNPENPNWRYFELDPSLDRPDDTDEIVTPEDIQIYASNNGLDAWHRWEATISPTTITYTLDLFRDGLDNVNGTPGVDASTVIDTIIVTDNGFNSLRIGGPSGVISPHTSAFDNVMLSLQGTGSTITSTHIGRMASSWDPNYHEFEPSENFPDEGIQLGAYVLFHQQQSVPTYSFAIPNPTISAEIYLSNLTISVTGKSNEAPGTGSGVMMTVGDNTWELPGENYTQTTIHAFTGGSGTDWSSIIESRNDGWFVDVTLSAIEDDDWYDLKDVVVTCTYTGITTDDLARLDQIARGVAQLDRFNTFHQYYLHDGHAVLHQAYVAFWAESAMAIANTAMGVAGATFGQFWSTFASGAFGLFIEPKITAILEWPGLTSTLAYGDWYFGNVIQGNTWTHVNTLHGTLITTRNALLDLGNTYYSALQDDGAIGPEETPVIIAGIDEADEALGNLQIEANYMASALVVATYNGTSEEYRENAGKAIDGYMKNLTLFYEYDYVLGSSSSPNVSESYMCAYRELLNLQDDYLPRLPVANAGGPYSANEGSCVTLFATNSHDPDGSIVSYQRDLDNDGQFDDATGPTVNFCRTDDGSYTVGVKVIDDEGGEDTDTATVTVLNVAPTADAGGPYTTNAGTDVILDVSDSDDPGEDIISYLWDFDNDGQFNNASGVNPMFPATKPGTYPICLLVTDDDGASDTDSTTVTVLSCPGDFNSDGSVNSADLGNWEDGFGTTSGANLNDGDADGDSDVDGNDFLAWQQNFGSSTASGSAASSSTGLAATDHGGSAFLSTTDTSLDSSNNAIDAPVSLIRSSVGNSQDTSVLPADLQGISFEAVDYAGWSLPQPMPKTNGSSTAWLGLPQFQSRDASRPFQRDRAVDAVMSRMDEQVSRIDLMHLHQKVRDITTFTDSTTSRDDMGMAYRTGKTSIREITSPYATVEDRADLETALEELTIEPMFRNREITRV